MFSFAVLISYFNNPLSLQAKAFDKKTSVLHYLVRLVKRNDDSLLSVIDDLYHVKEAQLVILDSLSNEIKALKEDIVPIRETIKAQAEEFEASGRIVQMSLKELKEQRTSIRNIDNMPQYNKIDHHTGRTPMERFVLHSEAQIAAAIAFTDSVKQKFADLLEYFGEDEGMASNDFFGTMTRFLADFRDAIEHVNREDKIKVSCYDELWAPTRCVTFIDTLMLVQTGERTIETCQREKYKTYSSKE